MWSHLNEAKGRTTNKLPVKRYYRVVALIAFHAFLDILSLIIFSMARNVLNSSAELSFFLQYSSTTVVAIHVGIYPFVYCGIRDLKFHDQLKERSKSKSSKVSSQKKETKSVEMNKPIENGDATAAVQG